MYKDKTLSLLQQNTTKGTQITCQTFQTITLKKLHLQAQPFDLYFGGCRLVPRAFEVHRSCRRCSQCIVHRVQVTLHDVSRIQFTVFIIAVDCTTHTTLGHLDFLLHP